VGALALVEDDLAETGRAILVDLLETNQEPDARQQALAALTSLDEVPVEPVARAVLTDPD
jgi:hypothetical protein